MFGRVKAMLLDRGRFTGDMDALVAAICVVNGQTLVTRNIRHFSAIPGLVVQGY
jgi:predicted nucleic acid-binding protein